jgi:hypothetical protein
MAAWTCFTVEGKEKKKKKERRRGRRDKKQDGLLGLGLLLLLLVAAKVTVCILLLSPSCGKADADGTAPSSPAHGLCILLLPILIAAVPCSSTRDIPSTSCMSVHHHYQPVAAPPVAAAAAAAVATTENSSAPLHMSRGGAVAAGLALAFLGDKSCFWGVCVCIGES